MQVNSYLRLQLLFGENKAPTFIKNLEKMITLILFDVEKEIRPTDKPAGLTVVGIIDRLNEVYRISFSDSEVLSAINGPHQTRIICSYQGRDFAQNEYSISPEEYARLEAREDENKLQGLIVAFLEKHPDVEYAPDTFLDLLQRHFYTVFNSNAATLLDLINRNYDYTDSLNTNEFEFSQEEKAAINKFLYWDNKEKNKCVYELVSCCFDYCMITCRQGTEAYRNIFNQKTFYLDANIVFRLMGVNHINRKRVIDTFIKKCNSLNVSVRVTNMTVQEIDETISHHVQDISSLLEKTEPLDPDMVIHLSSLGGSASFYIAYYNWCKDPANRVSDYAGFERDLKRQANEILGDFRQKNFDSFSEIETEKFNTYVSSLSSWKHSKRKSVYPPSIKTDVNNFMYVSSLNSRVNGTDFFSTHNYLISADHAFCDWAKELRPGAIPIVVLPSVWYSIMLQYSTRTDDDYASFTSFLNFSMSNSEGGNSAWKLEVLKKIISLEEPVNIRNEVGYNITERLKTGAIHDLDSEGVDEIVQEAYQSIVEQKVQEARAEERKLADERMASYKADVQHQISKVTYTAESDVNLAKAETERVKAEAAEERIRASETAKESYKSGHAVAKKTLIDTETIEETRKTKRRYWIITGLMVLASIMAVFAMFLWLSNQETLSEGLKEALDWLKYVVALVAFAGNALIIEKVFCGLDGEKIEKKVRKRVEYKYRYIADDPQDEVR